MRKPRLDSFVSVLFMMSVLGVMLTLHTLKERPAAPVPEAVDTWEEPAPKPPVPDPGFEIEPDRPAIPTPGRTIRRATERAVAALHQAMPLTFVGAEGVLTIPWHTNFDALVAEHPACASQVLDLVASRGEPCDMQFYRCEDLRFAAALKFCPAEWRR